MARNYYWDLVNIGQEFLSEYGILLMTLAHTNRKTFNVWATHRFEVRLRNLQKKGTVMHTLGTGDKSIRKVLLKAFF